MTHDASSTDESQDGIIARPPFQLRSLPIPMRWEANRRHPYYQMLWKTAAAAYQGSPVTQGPAEAILRTPAVGILGMIGVSGEPPDPATSFSELGADDLKAAWLSGAAHPISNRGLAALLLATLPKETLNELGVLFIEGACDDDESGRFGRIASMCRLQASSGPGLDQFCDEPFVSINPAVSGRKLVEAVGEALKDWKHERKLSEQRDRSDKYETYFNVWDRREGWTDGTYDLANEKTFHQVAQDVGLNPSSVSNHYRRAFEIIVGHPYTPELWWRTMGALKVVSFGFVTSAVSRRRPMNSPTRRPVPDTTLGQGVELLQQECRTRPSSETYSANDALLDVKLLLEEGKTDDEICELLEVPPNDVPQFRELIIWARDRNESA